MSHEIENIRIENQSRQRICLDWWLKCKMEDWKKEEFHSAEKSKQVSENGLGRKIAPGKKRRQVTLSSRQPGKIVLVL